MLVLYAFARQGAHALVITQKEARALGLVLAVLGILAMVYGGFRYTKEEKAAEVGPLELRAGRKERVNIPLWAGPGVAVVGAVLVLGAGRRSA